ncbi:hypothetical protein M405DRAFT_866579 [Rhizopogon salebrosus TDB-379]|nr:hypothetical protein M405DRAFT_866579 [Rhizopogon salebrosus TDB-379]
MQLRSSGSSPSKPISAWLTMDLASDSDEFQNLNNVKPRLPHKTPSSHENHIAFTEVTSFESHSPQWPLSLVEGLEDPPGSSSQHTRTRCLDMQNPPHSSWLELQLSSEDSLDIPHGLGFSNQFHPSSEKSSDIPKVPRSGIRECDPIDMNLSDVLAGYIQRHQSSVAAAIEEDTSSNQDSNSSEAYQPDSSDQHDLGGAHSLMKDPASPEAENEMDLSGK